MGSLHTHAPYWDPARPALTGCPQDLDFIRRLKYCCDTTIYSRLGIMTLEDYVTAIEAGRQLKVHPETVKRLCRQGDLPAEKLHNTWLIRKEVLDQFSRAYNPRPGAKRRGDDRRL